MIKSDQIFISKYLPHSAPFLFIDQLCRISQSEAETQFRVKKNGLLVVENHLSEEGLIEILAQTSSCITGQKMYNQSEGSISKNKVWGYLQSIQKVEVYQLPPVDSTLICKAILKEEYPIGKSKLCTFEASIKYNSKVLIHATLKLMIYQD